MTLTAAAAVVAAEKSCLVVRFHTVEHLPLAAPEDTGSQRAQDHPPSWEAAYHLVLVLLDRCLHGMTPWNQAASRMESHHQVREGTPQASVVHVQSQVESCRLDSLEVRPVWHKVL